MSAVGARAAGFCAISDDDFSRVGIAQVFAHAPRLDASGSSWLPFPFWLNGAAFAVLGRSLSVAVALAGLGAGAAGVLLYAAAGHVPGSPWQRAAAALAVLCLPIAPFLAAATVPELLAAALAVYGLAALGAGSPRAAVLGGLALLAATLSRYEVWPLALVGALLALRRVRAHGAFGVAASLALAGPLGWMLWNRHAHGDALWFLRRVAAFREAAGAESGSFVAYPWVFLRDGAALVLAVALAGIPRSRATAASLLPEARLSLLLGSAGGLLFLVAGDVVGGAPTHHPERALLPAWSALALAVIPLLDPRRLAAVLATAAVVLAVRARQLLPTFVDRREAIGEGYALRSLVPVGERIVVVRDTYATEATRAAFGRAEDLFPVVSSRFDARSQEDPLLSAETLRAAAERRGARYVGVDASRRDLARAVGHGETSVGSLVVVRLRTQ